jgi:hypothetical protein
MATPADGPDFQLTGDDPMIQQIEAATAGRVPLQAGSSPEAAPVAPEASARGPLDPGEPSWMQHEPDASQ